MERKGDVMDISRYAVTILGKDRPGIIAAITKVLYEKGGNIEDSSMTILEGEFAMILIVAFSGGLEGEELSRAFHSVEAEMGLRVFVKPLSEEELIREEIPDARPYTLSIFGGDRPGIVYRITSILAERGINITDMETKILEGDKGPLYAMVLEVDVPPSVDMDDLNRRLKATAEEMGIEVSIQPIEIYRL